MRPAELLARGDSGESVEVCVTARDGRPPAWAEQRASWREGRAKARGRLFHVYSGGGRFVALLPISFMTMSHTHTS